MIGKFIKDEWTSSDDINTWLRRISRETPTLLFSEKQRFFKDFGSGVDYRTFTKKFAEKYRKGNDGSVTKVGFRKKYRDLYNKLTVIDKSDLSELKCKYSYDELFRTDIRKIQKIGFTQENKNAEPLQKLIEYWEDESFKMFKNQENYFKLEKHVKLYDADWPFYPELTTYLNELFGVPVYWVNPWMKVNERFDVSKLSQSLTYFQITHFGDDKEVIHEEENRPNTTISFWYFDDRLIIQDESGKSTW
jgi:hypothetical protein